VRVQRLAQEAAAIGQPVITQVARADAPRRVRDAVLEARAVLARERQVVGIGAHAELARVAGSAKARARQQHALTEG
jgi:hypothetical protein